MEQMQLTTERLSVDVADASVYHPHIIRAGIMLREGKLVAFPTETVYGLGANALNAAAVERIFDAKRRPHWDPIIVHVSDTDMSAALMVHVPETFDRLQREFWPGPLTLLVRKSDHVPDIVTAGRPNVGLRMPAHPTAQALIRSAGLPLAAPSANLFSRTSPTTASQVREDLNGRIDAVIDYGRASIGLESTVLDLTQSPPVLYRPGAVTRDQIEAVIGPVVVYGHKQEAAANPLRAAGLPSPGVAMRHYAPKARLSIIEGGLVELVAAARQQTTDPEQVGLLVPTDWKVAELKHYVHFPWGKWGDWDQMAERLFLALRYLDERGVQVILAPLPGDAGIGAALRDRLQKAAR
ncbi:MAG: L-threonylcarbamoyladenylate synthase [Acidobacteriaceae bacterium]